MCGKIDPCKIEKLAYKQIEDADTVERILEIKGALIRCLDRANLKNSVITNYNEWKKE